MERAGDRAVWVVIGLLLTIMVVFIGLRLVTDVPNVLSGTLPDPEAFERRYAEYPWLAYAHILPGAIYLGIAPFQLWRGFRNRHLPIHRRMGRVALVAGLISGLFAIIFGLFLSFGGVLQATASIVFGVWFVTGGAPRRAGRCGGRPPALRDSPSPLRGRPSADKGNSIRAITAEWTHGLSGARSAGLAGEPA
jgi:hypothetical protein